MGQKVSPIGFRVGIRLGWASRWFAPKSNYGEFLVEDWKIRDFIDKRLNRQPPYAAISRIEIERTREEVKVTLKTARPGLVIGPRGAEVEKLKEALEYLSNRRVNVNVVEITKPDLDAQLAAETIAEQLKRRASFRRMIKQRCEAIMAAGAKGVKIEVSGRLGGAEMSRRVKQIMGSIPLQTLDADVDYGFVPAFTKYGALGVKVWIHRGMFGDPPPDTDTPRRGRRDRDGSPPPRRRQRRGGQDKKAAAPKGGASQPAGRSAVGGKPDTAAEQDSQLQSGQADLEQPGQSDAKATTEEGK